MKLSINQKSTLSRNFNAAYSKVDITSDARSVVGGESKAMRMICNSGVFGDLLSDVKTMFDMIRDHVGHNYTTVPAKTIAAVVAALLYLICPVDMIPDALPFIGLVDDAFIIRLCLGLVRDDLNDYRRWKAKKKKCDERFAS